MKSTSLRSLVGTSMPEVLSSGRSMSPFSVAPTISTGTTMHTSDAMRVLTMMFTVVT